MTAFGTALAQLAKLFSTDRRLWIPFVLVALAEIAGLIVVWLAPHPPFSALLAPPIRYFFGDRVLHYPWHLWFLYHVMKHVHVVVSVAMGAYLTGVACAMVQQTYQGRFGSLREALVSGHVRYKTVVAIWIVTRLVAETLISGVSRWANSGTTLLWLTIGTALILQMALAYAIPAAVFARTSWWKSILQSLREALRHPVSTLLMILVPAVLVIGLSVLLPSTAVARLMMRTAPEIALLCVGLRLVVWTAADAWLTIGVAHLWFIHRAEASGAAVREVSRRSGAHRMRVMVPLLLAAVTSGGCSEAYTGERMLWRAERLHAALAKQSAPAGQQQLAAVVEAYGNVTRTVPGTQWAGRALLAIGSLHAAQQRWDKAREVYGVVLQNHNKRADLCLTARTAIAKSFELEENWDAAVRMFHELSEFHPWSAAGMESPLYIAKGYEERKQSGEAARAYKRAVTVYMQRIAESPNEDLSWRVKSYLALTHQRLGEWDRAAEVLEELAQGPESSRPLALLSLGTIYQTKLKDPQKAETVYHKLFEAFPQHPFGQAAKLHLDRLQEPLTTAPVRAADAIPNEALPLLADDAAAVALDEEP